MIHLKPGILSDRQIRELCIPPTFIVRERVPASHKSNTTPSPLVHYSPAIHQYPVYCTESELETQPKSLNPEQLGIVDWRLPSENDLAMWFRPMISPFVPEQCKHIYRRAIPSQTVIIEKLRAAGADHDQIYAELRKEKPTVTGILTRDDQISILEKCVSFGLTSYGYDVRCGDEFKIFTNINSTVIDPHNFDDNNFVPFKGDVCIIPPNSFVLARTLERFDLPRDIVADCVGKSTYARCGISIMVTPLEPEWDGYLTLEFANTTPLPAKIYAGEGCGQIRFFRGSEPCEVSYRDRGGKYMGQEAMPVTPKV